MKRIFFLIMFYDLGFGMQPDPQAREKMFAQIACIKAGIVSKKNTSTAGSDYQSHHAEIQKCPISIDANGVYYLTYANQTWSMYIPPTR